MLPWDGSSAAALAQVGKLRGLKRTVLRRLERARATGRRQRRWWRRGIIPSATSAAA